ncbi:MAG TPA: hypothetical protein VN643_17735 [Pyrinomonadaceae bacterium]|nr:hypothetical protein [Pyrinomonadaceae bacterium]
MITITSYRLVWDVDNHVGNVDIALQGAQPIMLRGVIATEFAALAAILNESPIAWEPTTRAIVTGVELPDGA